MLSSWKSEAEHAGSDWLQRLARRFDAITKFAHAEVIPQVALQINPPHPSARQSCRPELETCQSQAPDCAFRQSSSMSGVRRSQPYRFRQPHLAARACNRTEASGRIASEMYP